MAGNNFRFWFPVEIEKSVDEQGKEAMMLKGLASTPRRDTDKESLDYQNFDINYARERGIINWNHSKAPEDIIGEPTKIIKKSNGLYVESMLYDRPKSHKVWELAKDLEKSNAKRRLGYSVEGKVLERDAIDKTKVTKALITNFALTISPKNADSIVDIMKGEFCGWEDGETPVYDDKTDEVVGKGLIMDIIRPDGMRVTVDSNFNTKIEKAMDTATGKATMPESVDGEVKFKDRDKKLSKKPAEDNSDPLEETTKGEENYELQISNQPEYLTQTDVLDRIMRHNSVITLSKANEIFEILNNLNMATKKDTATADSTTEEKTNVSSDLLDKALAQLDLNKGEGDDEGEGEEEKKPAAKIEKGEKGKKKVAAKVADDEGADDDDDDEPIEKSNTPAKGSKKQAVAPESNDDKISKAIEVLMSSTTESLEKGFATQHEDSKSLGIILKGMYDEMKDMRSELAEVRNMQEEINTTPAPGAMRKSITNATPVARNFNTAVGDNLQKGNEAADGKKAVSITRQKPVVLDMMDKLAYNGKDGFNKSIADAMSLFECSGQGLTNEIQKSIETEFGVELTF